jgi:hypothetical protein
VCNLLTNKLRDHRLTIPSVLALGAAAFAFMALPCTAGPCLQEIDRMQIEVDARIEAIAGTGPTARESTAATLRHQPTPGSLAAAEEKLGEGAQMADAVAALARARAADHADDKAACEQALADVRRALAAPSPKGQ